MVVTYGLAMLCTLVGSRLIDSLMEKSETNTVADKTEPQKEEDINEYFETKISKVKQRIENSVLNNIQELLQAPLDSFENLSKLEDEILKLKFICLNNGISFEDYNHDHKHVTFHNFIDAYYKSISKCYCEYVKPGTASEKWNKLENFIKLLILNVDDSSLLDQYYSITDKIPYNKENNNLNKIFENIKKKNESINDPNEELKDVNYSYFDLLNDCGKIYSELLNKIKSNNYFINIKECENYIYSQIAESVLKENNFYFLKGVVSSELAKEIKKEVINFQHHNQPQFIKDKGETAEETNKKFQKFLDNLEEDYYMNREIKYYYYFLIQSARFVQSVCVALKTIDPSKCFDDCLKETRDYFFTRKSIESLKKSVLKDLKDEDIWNQILASKAENKEKESYCYKHCEKECQKIAKS